jgi:SLIDE
MAQIERGEAKIQRRAPIKRALDEKMNWQLVEGGAPAAHQLLQQQVQELHREEDRRFLFARFTSWASTGTTSTKSFRAAVRAAPKFRLGWFLKSRIANELQHIDHHRIII